MQTLPVCYSCIVHDLNGAMELLPLTPEQRWEVVRRVNAFMGEEFRPGVVPSYYITEVHRILKDVSGIATPFAPLRESCNRVGMAVAARVAAEVASLPPPERFRQLVLWSIAGNHLDFRTVGTGYDFDLDAITGMLNKAMAGGLYKDEIPHLYEAALLARRVLFIHDNVGEIALDKLLIRELVVMGAEVVSALRGGPITSDATMEDGETVGMAEAATRVILAGPDTLGISLEEMSPELARELETADLILAKGQANYYVLSEYVKLRRRPVVSLFSTKCQAVAGVFGAEPKVNNMAVFL